MKDLDRCPRKKHASFQFFFTFKTIFCCSCQMHHCNLACCYGKAGALKIDIVRKKKKVRMKKKSKNEKEK
jgi:hypothetical protein